MQFKDTIPWDIIDAPVPDQFFGKDVKRVNLIRHGIKNGIITQQRVLNELKKLEGTEDLTPKSKYKGNVARKIKWIEEFYFPECMEQIRWFEEAYGDSIRQLREAAKQIMEANKTQQMLGASREVDLPFEKKAGLGTYPKGIGDMNE